MPSQLALAARCAVGGRVHGRDRLLVALQDGEGLAAGEVPQPDRPVAPARDGAARAREGDGRDRPVVARQGGLDAGATRGPTAAPSRRGRR